ncbi:Para-nitrobenzyl esterase [uncultured Clostridium sp.]|uniref:carboxylesterase family protein n=1 Tax=uncultured Clostridium sp. TaxID=59620 RepID=UPI000822FC85|nr:carboxylesterase family protein [uncultured Clostridium sp.]SCJ89935.1 Para-nitrobenzyl esterase [uncultured Clostridium sp.]
MEVKKMPEIDFGKEGSIIIKTKKGEIKGVIHDGVAVFKGIPYAKPPVGDLRFAPSQDIEAWEGVLEGL